jgi:hypothetical protein
MRTAYRILVEKPFEEQSLARQIRGQRITS